MVKEYLNEKLLGAVVLIALAVTMHLGFFHILLIIPFFIGVIFLNERKIDNELTKTWHGRARRYLSMLLSITAVQLLPGETIDSVKVILESTFFVGLLSVVLCLSYYNQTCLRLLVSQEKV